MNIYLAFSGEDPTDNRFMTILINRMITEYLLEKEITAEISWIYFKKDGTSEQNLLKVSENARDQDIIVFHRDSDNNSWDEAYKSHFEKAIKTIEENDKNRYNKQVIPLIPVRETEAWMLANKNMLKRGIETTLNNNVLSLNYKLSRIENITDPKSIIENAINVHHQSLTRKQRRYAIRISDLYDIIATQIPLEDLEVLDSFKKFKKSLNESLDNIFLD